MSADNMCVPHAPFISGLSQQSALFSAKIMVPLFIPEGILVFRYTKWPHPPPFLIDIADGPKIAFAVEK